MPGIPLRALVGPKSESYAAIKALCDLSESPISVADRSGKLLLGSALPDEHPGAVIESGGETMGFVVGSSPAAGALVLLLNHLAAREAESRSLGAEVLHLYREANLIEQLSEQLAALLDLEAVSQLALAQAQRLIPATQGCILVMETPESTLRIAANFGADSQRTASPLGADSAFVSSLLERGIAEIVNNCAADPRSQGAERDLGALIYAPLRAGQRTVGIIALANSEPSATYSAANLKLLNTIALQTAAAIANALLAVEMVGAAQSRAAFAAELQAASTVQQLLLQSASRSTPGFLIESVYLPASEVGGDFFFVAPAPDGSLTALVGDVSGKGLTAAMRVAMILGALRRETSHDPGEILFELNNALIAQGQLGFTTACCARIFPSGGYILANAGHIAPYLSGRELETPPSLPLGLVPMQSYELTHGELRPGDRMVLMSDGVPEARAASGELYGFDRLSDLVLQPAQQIAEAAQHFGQEDDITVLTIAIAQS